MFRKSRVTPPRAVFNEAQTQCLRGFAAQVLGSESAVCQIHYHLLGCADLADHDKAVAMLRALRSEDWASASNHNALAGANNLVLGILLRIHAGTGTQVDYWVAMRSPFDILEAPTLVACGKVASTPQVKLTPLFADTEL